MTRSSTKNLLTPFKELEQVLHSTRKLFKTRSLDYSSSPEFDLFSDLENQSEEEVTEAMMEPPVLRDNAFSGTNGEDVIEHIENFLEIVHSLNIPNVSNNQLRVRVFPMSLTGAASKWWEDKKIEANGDRSEVKWDPNNIEFENSRGDDEEVITNSELSNPRDDNFIEENEIAQIFRIDIDIFGFETPLCEAFKESNYLSQIDIDVNERPWTDDGVWTEPINNICHECNPLRFKNGTAKWPTCNWKEDGYCNTRDLRRFIPEGNSICYKDYEWYDTIEDSELKEEALINKKILEESINVMKESSDYEWDHDSPINEWKDYEHTTYIKTGASSNQDTYNHVCQIVMDLMKLKRMKDGLMNTSL
ncbi:hypothetical protein Tco_0348042 [Tanacetum coccineum]